MSLVSEDDAERRAAQVAFGVEARRWRERGGYSQDELNARLGWEAGDLRKVEIGARDLPLSRLLALADALAIRPGRLIDRLPVPMRRASHERILALLAEYPGITKHHLAERLDTSVSHLHRVLPRLEQDGEIVRQGASLRLGPTAGQHEEAGGVQDHTAAGCVLSKDELSRRIAAARLLRDYTQEDLDGRAAADGLGLQELSRTERGELALTRVRREAYSRLLAMPEDWFRSGSIDSLIHWPEPSPSEPRNHIGRASPSSRRPA